MITKKQALEFANDWIESWNAHDLENIILHYDENVEYYSTENFGKLFKCP